MSKTQQPLFQSPTLNQISFSTFNQQISPSSIDCSFQTAKFGFEQKNPNFVQFTNNPQRKKNHLLAQEAITKSTQLKSFQEFKEKSVKTKKLSQQIQRKQNYSDFKQQGVIKTNYKCGDLAGWKSAVLDKVTGLQKEIKYLRDTVKGLKKCIEVQEYEKKYSLKKFELALLLVTDSLATQSREKKELQKNYQLLEQECEKSKKKLKETNHILMDTILINSSLTIKIQKLTVIKNQLEKLKFQIQRDSKIYIEPEVRHPRESTGENLSQIPVSYLTINDSYIFSSNVCRKLSETRSQESRNEVIRHFRNKEGIFPSIEQIQVLRNRLRMVQQRYRLTKLI